jgi:hypothetical protein
VIEVAVREDIGKRICFCGVCLLVWLDFRAGELRCSAKDDFWCAIELVGP